MQFTLFEKYTTLYVFWHKTNAQAFAAAGVDGAKPGGSAAAGNESCFTQLRHNFHSL